MNIEFTSKEIHKNDLFNAVKKESELIGTIIIRVGQKTICRAPHKSDGRHWVNFNQCKCWVNGGQYETMKTDDMEDTSVVFYIQL